MTMDDRGATEHPPDDPAPPAAAFDELGHSGGAGSTGAPLEALLDLSLPVTIEFGRTHLTVQEVLQLGRGSVIQLDRLAGEPIDILVSERKLAEGEVVVIGEHFGIRITRLASLPGGGSGRP
jgi:flagellar motor switch protein FliN/FliY